MRTDPHDPDLRAFRGIAGHGVEGPPSVRQFQSEEVGQTFELLGDQPLGDSVAEERLGFQALCQLAEPVSLQPLRFEEFVLVDDNIDFLQSRSLRMKMVV